MYKYEDLFGGILYILIGALLMALVEVLYASALSFDAVVLVDPIGATTILATCLAVSIIIMATGFKRLVEWLNVTALNDIAAINAEATG